MKTLVSLQDVHFQYDSSPLFAGLDFSLNEGEKVAIVGHNGCGKSTMLSLIDRKQEPERGIVTYMRGLRHATVEQFLPAELSSLSLRDAVLAALSPEQRECEPYRADVVLDELFFRPEEGEVPAGKLSGGQKNRLMLARAIIDDPDLVLMDEPTNHMDVETLVYIEDYLRHRARFAFAIISHDRRFLDRVTDKTVVLRDGKAHAFQLPYSRAMEQLAAMDEHARRARALEAREIERLQTSAHRLAMWGRTFDNEDLSRKAKSMEKRIEKLSSNRTFVSQGNPYQLQLATGSTRSKLALQFHDYDVHYGETLRADRGNLLFHIDETYVETGQRVAILGKNGVGKTTFLQGIVDRLNLQDEASGFRHSPNLTLGLYDQEQAVLDQDRVIADEVRRRVDLPDDDIKKALIAAGFAYRDHGKPIAALSGGERARIILLTLSLCRPNFLILDEPTNHIDLDGRAQLEELLLASQATVLVTGHDREFIDRVANRFFMIADGRLIEVSSADHFYDTLLPDSANQARLRRPGDRPAASTGKASDPASASDAQDDILARIVELEQKLTDDRARKAKFQKPKRQAAWEREIQRLYEQLE